MYIKRFLGILFLVLVNDMFFLFDGVWDEGICGKILVLEN